MRLGLISLLILLATGAWSQDLAIVGGRIEIGNGKSLPKGTVLVRGGRIAAVGASVPVPAGMATFDAAGLVVYPGFVDGFSTAGLKLPAPPEPAPARDVASQAPPTMWDRNRKGIFGRVEAAKCLDLAGIMSSAHKAGITTALLSPGSGLVRGQLAVAHLTDEKVDATPFGVGLSFRGTGGGGPGVGGGGAGGAAYPGTLLGFTSLLRQTLADAQTYAIGQGVPEDLDLKGMAPLIGKKTPAIFAADSDGDIFRALQTAREFGFAFLISGGREAYARADQLANERIPVLVNIAIGAEPGIAVQPDGPPKEVLEERRNQWREVATNVLKLDSAKVPYAFSSDASGFGDYLANIRKLVQLGLKKESALKAMTVVPATLFGMEKDLGTIETGKIANLTLMNGDFAESTSEVKAVFVRGKKFEVKK